jgi:glycosyltransferase involved in cell wall biosynthesis
MRIAAFTRYAGRAASTRQRFLQYFPALRAAGIDVEHHPLLDDDYVAHLATGEPYPAWRVARAYGRRFRELRASRNHDLYWVYVEMLPYFPAFVERLAASGKPIVYDFDDAFFHTYDQSRNAIVRALLAGKHASLLRRAKACVCGNTYLRGFAVHFCRNSVILPTVVDTNAYRVAGPHARPLTIGWIGSPSTWHNVRPLLPVFKELHAERGVTLKVIGAGAVAKDDLFDGLELVEWSEEREVHEIREMDIGIMPLVDTPFERGKSGYKLIQYMACGVPAVASPVGVNESILDGSCGLLARTPAEWKDALVRLLDDQGLRHGLGAAGRERAVANYSLDSQAPRLIQVFRSIAAH